MAGTRHLALPLLLVSLLGCHQPVPGQAPRPDADLLTQEQMLERNFTNVYDAIAAVHANWLVVRGTDSFSSPSEIWVYQDSNRLGGVETLKAVSVRDIAYVRHYNGIDATARWGVGHSAGVIFLSSHQ